MLVGLAQLSSSWLEPEGASSTSPMIGSAACGVSSSVHLSIVTQALKPDKTSINIPGKNTGAAALGLDMVFQIFSCISFSALKKSPDINENLSINPNQSGAT